MFVAFTYRGTDCLQSCHSTERLALYVHVVPIKPIDTHQMSLLHLLESPTVRWTIAVVHLGAELLCFVVLADLFWIDQVIAVVVSVIASLILPSALKSLVEHYTVTHSHSRSR